jgi:hypothetical protein
VFPIVFVAALLAGCSAHREVVSEQSRDRIYDFTAKRSPVCEVHGATMSPQVVELEFGMKMITDTDKARRELFPHAHEPYHTGYCVPLVERRGRVFVCPRCTEARAVWFSTLKTAHK